MSQVEFAYQGSELELFEHATVWKGYWSAEIRPYIGAKVLEVGAGIGTNTQMLVQDSGGEWLCLEPDADQCRAIEERIANGGIPKHVGVKCGTLADAEGLGKFDTILYIDVLEHIEHDSAELALAADVLEAGGNIIVLSPAHNSLFSEFDRHVGHWRRYDKAMLREILPSELTIKKQFYLDSVGMLASYANKALLKSSLPTPAQINLWDKVMVRVSKLIDPLLLQSFGKTIIGVYGK